MHDYGYKDNCALSMSLPDIIAIIIGGNWVCDFSKDGRDGRRRSGVAQHWRRLIPTGDSFL